MKECIAYITYRDGSTTIEVHSLKDSLSFSLKEMEVWVREQSSKPVKKVRCSKIPPKLLKLYKSGELEHSLGEGGRYAL